MSGDPASLAPLHGRPDARGTLCKPFTAAALLAIVRRVLAESPSAEAATARAEAHLVGVAGRDPFGA